jgi:signal transduction histidine kinase
MYKSALLIVAILSLNLNIVQGNKYDHSATRNVLVLFSFSPSIPTYRYLIEGINQELTAEFGDSYNIQMEFLESERYPEGEYPLERFDLYNKKYIDARPDLLICVGMDIVRIIKRCGAPYLRSLPAISVDLSESKYGIPFDMMLNRHTTLIAMELDPLKTISEALEIFPATTSLYFVCGTSRIDNVYEKVTREAVKHIDAKISISFITDKAMNEVVSIVKNLPGNSLIFVPSLVTDALKVPYFNPESVRLISRSANVPVFTFSDIGIGDGSFGGEILSFKKAGQICGESAVNILKGTDPAAIKIDCNACYDYLLDERLLVKWNRTGLERKKPGIVVMFREESFIQKYKWLVASVVLFLIFQTFLISNLIRMNRRQREMTSHIVDTDRRYMEIVLEDRILRMGMLTASLSHELNQPLSAILSTAQAGKRFTEADKTDPFLLQEIFNNIIEDNNRAASILRSIRGMLKMDKREKERVNLNNLITETSDLYYSKAVEQNTKLMFFLADKPVFVMADAIQIQQVLLNLITNAVQSTEQKQGSTRIVNIHQYTEDDYVTVSVRDYGKGIDESIMKKLFKPFVTTKTDGSGIGLSLGKLIIEDHQGKIWARNMADGGAEFSFKLKINNG